MPINGAIWKGSLRFRVSASGQVTHSGDGSGAFTASCNGYTLFVPNVINVSSGFTFECYTYDNGDGAGVRGGGTYYGPAAPFGGLHMDAPGGGTLEVLLTDVTVWCRNTGGLPQIDFTIKVLFNGVLKLGPQSFSYVGNGVGPNYVPLLGSVGAECTIHCSTVNLPLLGSPSNPHTGWQTYASGSTSLAYEAQEDGSTEWLSFPVSILGGSFSVEGSDTSAITVTGYQQDDQTSDWEGSYTTQWYEHNTAEYSTQEGGFLLVPGGNRDLSRMAPDYRSTLYHSGYPQTKSITVSGRSNDDGSENSRVYTEVHPSLTAFKGSIGDGSHVVLDPLTYPAYACTRSAKEHSTLDYSVTFSGNLQSIVVEPEIHHAREEDGFAFPAYMLYNGGVEDTDTNPYLGDWQYHVDPNQRYFGSWGSPYWKLGQWFPPAEIDEEGGQAPQSQWPLDGSSVSPQYWKLIRSQWSGEPSAPAEERTRRRSDLIGSAVEASGLTILWDNYWPQGFLRPLGWSRSPVMDSHGSTHYENCPDSLQLRADSAPSWASSDAALTFGAGGITVTPNAADQLTAKVRLSLNGWAASPFLYPQTCGSVSVGFTAADALALAFVSALGGSSSITGVADGATVAVPLGKDKGYSGSWGVENGAGFTDDLGTDEAKGGQSYAAMGDPSRAQSFGALTARQAATLEFTITLSRDGDDHARPATLRFPTFHRAAGNPTVVYLTGSQSAIVWPDGPCIVYGNELYWDGMSFNVPPLLTGGGYSPTIIDAIAVRRAYLQGVHPLTGGTTGTGTGTVVPPLSTELAERYTAFEGQSIAQVDQHSWTFILPSYDGAVRWLLGNSYQEVPPMAMLMAPRRAAHTYASGGQPWGGVYDLCKEPRDVLSPTTALALYDDEGALKSTPATAPSGWKIERYNVPVTNDESTDWELRQGDTVFAKVRPWHGWTWAGQEGELRGSLSSDVAGHGRHVLAYVNDGKAKLKLSSNSSPTDYTDIDPHIDADSVCVRWLRDDKEGLRLMYAKDDVIYYRTSTDEGVTFDMPTTIDTGSTPTFIVSRTGLRYEYWLVKNSSSYDIKGQIRSGTDDVIKPTFTVKSGVDGDGVTVREAFQSQGKHVLIIDYVEGGTIKSTTSNNGIDEWS